MNIKIWIIVMSIIMFVTLSRQVLVRDEFEIYNSLICSSNSYESVTLKVIVNKKHYDPIEMFEKVYMFYCQYNEVNELTINLYDSKSDFEQGKFKAKKTYLID